MNDWYFLVLFEILGYLEGTLRRDSSLGSRGGGSRLWLCKQDVDSKIDLTKLCDSRSLRLSRSSSSATNKAFSIRHVTCATKMIRSYCPFCIASIWFFRDLLSEWCHTGAAYFNTGLITAKYKCNSWAWATPALFNCFKKYKRFVALDVTSNQPTSQPGRLSLSSFRGR